MIKIEFGCISYVLIQKGSVFPDKSGKYEEGEGPVESFNLFNFQGSYKFNQFINVRVGSRKPV